MKKKNLLSLAAIFFSLWASGQTIDNNCNGSVNPVFSTWTQLAPTDAYIRIVKKNGMYYLRAASEVYSSNSIDGPWTSLNFFGQTGIAGNNSLHTLEVTSQNDILIATPASGIYLFSGGNWQPIGLSGTGTNGIFAAELQNNRLLVMRAGFLRDLYITDNQGFNWTNVTNGNTDWLDCIITNSGTILVSAGNGGLIRSQDNGNSFQDISSSVGTTQINSITMDCTGSIYALTDIGIYQSNNDGTNWNFISTLPINANNINPLASGFLVGTEGFYVFNDISGQAFSTSNDTGNTWQDITDYPGDLSLIKNISEIDGNLVVCGIDGVWAKTISFCVPTNSSETETECDSYTWNADGITYTQSGQYTAVLSNAAGCDSTVSLDLTIIQPTTGSETITECNSFTWDANNQTYTATGQYTAVLTNAVGCDSTVTLDLTIDVLSISIQPTSQTVNINTNAEFTVILSDPNATYQWQTDLGVGFQNMTNSGQYSGVTTNTLTIANTTNTNNNQQFRCIIASGSCSDTSDVALLTVVNNVGINEFNHDNLFSVYPNPAQSLINVKADAKLLGSVYTIYDYTGKVVLSGKIIAENTVIELGNLSGGIYLFSVGENKTQNFKVVKE